MSGMTSGVCVESDLSTMLQRSSAPSHHHPNHHGYGGQGQMSSLAPMLDYGSEMDRYRSSIASFYKTNVNMNVNVTNFPQSSKLAARLAAAGPIFPPAAAARLGAMATAPWGCHDNMNHHPAAVFWGRPKPAPTHPHHPHPHPHPHHAAGHMAPSHHGTSMHQGGGGPGGGGGSEGGGAEKLAHSASSLPAAHHQPNGNFLQTYGGRGGGLRRCEQTGTRPHGYDGPIRGRQLQRGRGDERQLPGGTGITPRGHRHGDGVGRRGQRLPDDGWRRTAVAHGLPAARELLAMPVRLLALVVGGDGRGGRGPVVHGGGGSLVGGWRGQAEEEAVRRVRAVQAAHQLRRVLVVPQQEDGSPDLQVQEV
ncbi:hypothetical protein PFLUV_G00170800 [Perca fluviatilis]|uniref:Uncharacterized protein n=1 Tax=Perca fluviatilis TaxID=8168 RepID=A0A6A5F1X4_PERFL|nr:hypothetical protein PFLUV_G00170800 [Perca fluviatilis]